MIKEPQRATGWLVVIVTATKYNKWSGIGISEIRGEAGLLFPDHLLLCTSFSSACYICFFSKCILKKQTKMF